MLGERRKKSFLKKMWQDRTLVLMVLPAVIMLIMFNYIPMSGLVLAFKKFNYSLGLYKSPWVGLENFRFLFVMGDTFWRITRNTILYYFAFTIVGTIVEVAIAIAINELVLKRASKLIQSIMIMPMFLSWVAVRYIVDAMLAYDSGVISNFICNLTGNNINFYMQPEYWPLILVIVNLWKTAGYGSVLYLSALSGIDPQLYEAATIDGANRRQERRYITIPMLSSIIIVKTLLGLGSIMHSETGIFYQVTKNIGSLYSTTQVLDSYLLNAIQTSTNFSTTAAATLYQSVIGLILIIVVNAIVRRISPENAMY